MESEDKNLSIDQQFQLLRSLSQSSSIIYEAQLSQIKYWWNIITPNAADIKINISNKLIEFHHKDKVNINRKVKSILLNSVRYLLGSDWSIRIRNERRRASNPRRNKKPNRKRTRSL